MQIAVEWISGARREACRREDAVFSRVPGWFERGFMLLCGLGVDSSFGLSVVATVGLLFQPAFELVVLLEKELERFAYDVGRSCVDELDVPVQVVSDFFLQANLKGCSFWLFQWCFQ